MNRGEIRNAVLESLEEDTGAPVGWSIAMLNRAIDDTYRLIVRNTKSVVEDIVLTVQPASNFVALPRRVIAVFACMDQPTGLPIDPVEWEWIDRDNRLWIRAQAERPLVVAGWGLGELMFDRFPTIARNVVATCAIMPIALISDFDVPSLPEEHHIAIVRGVHHAMLLLNPDMPRFERAMKQWKTFAEMVSEIGVWATKRNEGLAVAIYGEKLRRPGAPASMRVP